MGQLRVAVIGSGAAGLAALRVLSEQPQIFQPVAFEQRPATTGVGGLWNYYKEPAAEHSSPTYTHLVTNLPKEIMAFQKFPFSEHDPKEDHKRSFVSHWAVSHYLKRFARELDLTKFVKFDSTVTKVSPIQNSTKWNVQWNCATDDTVQHHHSQFDAIMICTGHFAVPHIPRIDGVENYSGILMHSSEYREPSLFRNKTVCVLGAGNSGVDIALEISKTASQVHLCFRKESQRQSALPSNLSQHCAGVRAVIGPQTIALDDDTQLTIDILLLCTGYQMNYPFLEPNLVRVLHEGHVVSPLYKHIFSIDFPSLAFIGLNKNILPFPLFEQQARLVAAHLTGRWMTPSKEAMLSEVSSPDRYHHVLSGKQWDYHSYLSAQSGSEPTPEVIQKIYETVTVARRNDVQNYKKYNYRITASDSFEEYVFKSQ